MKRVSGLRVMRMMRSEDRIWVSCVSEFLSKAAGWNSAIPLVSITNLSFHHLASIAAQN